MAAATETPSAEEALESTGKSPLVTVAKIGAFVFVVLSLETLFAFLFIPSAEDVSAMAEARYGAETIADPISALEEDNSDELTVEVDLGEYTVTAYQPLSNTTLRIDFHLFGTVAQSKQAEFNEIYMAKEKRLREQVIVTARSSEVTDLTDAGLGLIKRKIHDKINRTLDKPMVKSIIVSEFSFVEQ